MGSLTCASQMKFATIAKTDYIWTEIDKEINETYHTHTLMKQQKDGGEDKGGIGEFTFTWMKNSTGLADQYVILGNTSRVKGRKFSLFFSLAVDLYTFKINQSSLSALLHGFWPYSSLQVRANPIQRNFRRLISGSPLITNRRVAGIYPCSCTRPFTCTLLWSFALVETRITLLSCATSVVIVEI